MLHVVYDIPLYVTWQCVSGDVEKPKESRSCGPTTVYSVVPAAKSGKMNEPATSTLLMASETVTMSLKQELLLTERDSNLD